MLHFGRVSKVKRGWSAARKIIVFVLTKRKAQLKAMPILAHERFPVMLQIPTKALKGLCRTQTNGKHTLNAISTQAHVMRCSRQSGQGKAPRWARAHPCAKGLQKLPPNQLYVEPTSMLSLFNSNFFKPSRFFQKSSSDSEKQGFFKQKAHERCSRAFKIGCARRI